MAGMAQPVPQYRGNAAQWRDSTGCSTPSPTASADNTEEYVVPEGHYFMMGDNRDNSQDSRYLSFVGYVPIENFVGRADIIFFSISPDASPVRGLAVALRHSLEPLFKTDLTGVVRFSQLQYDTIAARIGYDFRDKALLRHALTHASGKGKTQDYERLEFLGDRVLGLVIAEQLYRDHPQAREGDMSGRHSALVRRETCAEAGRAIGLTDFIIVGTSERAKGMNLNQTVVGDVMEALIAAIYSMAGSTQRATSFCATGRNS